MLFLTLNKIILQLHMPSFLLYLLLEFVWIVILTQKYRLKLFSFFNTLNWFPRKYQSKCIILRIRSWSPVMNLNLFITDRFCTIESKFGNIRNIINFSNFILISNYNLSIKIENSDQRYLILECSDNKEGQFGCLAKIIISLITQCFISNCFGTFRMRLNKLILIGEYTYNWYKDWNGGYIKSPECGFWRVNW
jgi:hypothetical protein